MKRVLDNIQWISQSGRDALFTDNCNYEGVKILSYYIYNYILYTKYIESNNVCLPFRPSSNRSPTVRSQSHDRQLLCAATNQVSQTSEKF